MNLVDYWRRLKTEPIEVFVTKTIVLFKVLFCVLISIEYGEPAIKNVCKNRATYTDDAIQEK